MEEAQKWLRTEEYDFREREILTIDEVCDILDVPEWDVNDVVGYYEEY